MKPRYDAIPEELRDTPNWVCWKLEKRANKSGVVRETKVPYNARTFKRAKSNTPSTWSSFGDAAAALKQRGYDGLGFCLTPPYVGVDLDGCRLQDGTFEPVAKQIIDELDSYSELSPSTLGAHVMAKGAALPDGPRQLDYKDREHHGVGLYDAFRGRYLTMTGIRIGGNGVIAERTAELHRIYQRLFPPRQAKPQKRPVSLRTSGADPDDELIARARVAKDSGKFSRLWDGQWEGEYSSQSEADLALCMKLAFWTDRAATRIDALFRRSGLMREKWNRTDYRELTIAKATEQTTDTWAGINVDLLPFHHNDVGNAQRFIALKGEDFRYCYAVRCWFSWDGRRWARDGGGVARLAAQEAQIEFLRQATSKAGDESPAAKFARQSLDSRRLSAMLVEAEPHLVIAPDELDTDPNLLAFWNGVVDLRTGELRPHRREDFISKLVPFNFTPSAACPLFRCFLNRIMGSKADLSQGELEHVDRRVSYLQAAIGYSMTGRTSEKALFLPYGKGNNGKTTLLSLFLRLLPEHSALLQIDSLMIRQESNNTQADLADLRGARFVMTSETEEGQRLAEGKLKRITQGMGKIKAVRKYENPIEFPETHKLWLDCNHRPVVRGSDNAIWNRLHLIPFQETIQPEEMDRDLPNKLYAEAEGILAWGVDGAVRWFREGLGRPSEVDEAVRQYRDEMDQIGRFVSECCVTGDYAQVKARQLYQAYRKWTEDGGEHPITEAAFSRRMAERGFEKQHTEHGKVYFGIGLLVPDEEADGKKADGKADG